MKQITDLITKYWQILSLTLLTAVLRFKGLGYSDFQGDEIKALFRPAEGQKIAEFLLTQRKGPIQFLITYVLKLFDPTYSNEFFVRFVFALAGTIAVVFFYKFLRYHFSERVSYFAAFFFATNGFLIAFSRIVQYQSFVIMFMVMALWAFSKAVYQKSWKLTGIYLGFIFWALSILAHYDGVFIGPFVIYLIGIWVRKYQKQDFKHILFGGMVFVVMLAAFYVPFVISLDEATLNYWKGRQSSSSQKLSSTMYLFSVYHPIYIIHIYTGLFLLGIARLFIVRRNLILRYIDAIRHRFTDSGLKAVYAVTKLHIMSSLYGTWLLKYVFLLAWVFSGWIFLEWLIDIPGTHVYVYLIPATTIIGNGVVFIYKLAELIVVRVWNLPQFKKALNIKISLGVTLVFAFMFMQSYAVFVDHKNGEYPWTSEKFYIWEFPKPSPIFHLSMFGFPYYRHWDDISEFVNNDATPYPCPKALTEVECLEFREDKPQKVTFYSTNERKSIARYHTSFAKSTDKAGYYIFIKNPQSFTNDISNVSEKAYYWTQNYPPVATFENGDKTVSEIYYMPVGELDEIIEQGY